MNWKITARNYAAQCERSLREIAPLMDTADEADIVTRFCDKVRDAVHFVMPDGGGLFDDKGKGIFGQELRLPFPLVTIEYHCENYQPELGLIQMPKRVIVAEEVDVEEARSRVRRFAPKVDPFIDDRYIVISWSATSPRDGKWVPGPASLAIPTNWDANLNDPEKKNYISLTGNRDVTRMNGIPIVQLESMAMRYVATLGSPSEAMTHMVHDVATEAGVLIEFCEALSCSNVGSVVSQSALPASKAARRERDGKLPIYETRMLVIDAGGPKHARTATGGDGSRSSPAQHLRRGHIRRLPSGKNIWVNSCVVGTSEHGVVDKTYAVRRAS